MTKKLLQLVETMQGKAADYVEPGFYTDREGNEIRYDKCGGKSASFVYDLLYLLDGPEQREAQAEAETVANFIPDALRTCSPGFHGDKVTISQLIAAIQAGIAAANRLDRMKKALFYGRDYVENDARPQVTAAEDNETAAMIISGVMPIDDKLPLPDAIPYEQLFHAIIGNFTEAGEQLEAWLKTYLFGGKIDAVNMREEFGDNLWYLAIGMDAVERMTGEPCDFATEMSRVIKKLRLRFPDKFTADAANNRDLAAERAVLEGGEKTSD